MDGQYSVAIRRCILLEPAALDGPDFLLVEYFLLLLAIPFDLFLIVKDALARPIIVMIFDARLA